MAAMEPSRPEHRLGEESGRERGRERRSEPSSSVSREPELRAYADAASGIASGSSESASAALPHLPPSLRADGASFRAGESGESGFAGNAPGAAGGKEMPETLGAMPATARDAALAGASYGSARALPREMTPEEERVLVEHLPIVRFLARRIHERLPQHVEIDDLFSAGVVGLMDAFAKFDSTKKVQFRSYAQFRIRGAILDSLRTLDWSPRELRRKGRAVEEAMRSLTSRFGRAPSETEVAQELGMALDAYHQLLGDLKGLEIGTLHLERNEDSGEEELAYVPGRPDEDPLFRCLRGEMEGRLTGAIQELPERERLVMTLYYYEEMTMREIGMALGVVESRVSQIHASAVLHLRTALADLASRQGAATRTRARQGSGKTHERAERSERLGGSGPGLSSLRPSPSH